MSDYRYGPVEFYLVGFEGERPSAGTLAALTDLVSSGLVRLLDFVLLSKDADGELTVVEVEETEDFGLDIEILQTSGIAGDEDIEEFGSALEPGTSGALVVFELVYARELAQRLSESGGAVLGFDRVPAPVVNALMDSIEESE
jgi:hypothetical protein